MKRLLLGLCLCCVLASGRAETLRVPFATGEYRPYTSASLPGFGAAAELVAAICKAADIEPVFRFYPWKRAELNLQAGTVFAAFPYSITPERSAQFDFSEPLYQVRNALVYYDRNRRTRLAMPYQTLADLRGYRIGVIAGSFAETRLKAAGLPYETAATTEQSVRKLQLDRLDVYIDDEAAIFDTVQRLFPAELAQFHALAVPFDQRRPNHLMVSRRYPDAELILQRFNEGLAKLRKSGEYDRLLASHHLGR